MLKRRLVGNQLLDLMLGEIADPQFAGGDDAAGLGCQLTREQPRQGRLAVAVAADQRHAVVGVDAQVQVRQHGRTRHIADGDAIEHDERRLELLRARKIEHDRRVPHGLGDRLHRGERLEPALRLARGVRLVAPAIDIGLQLLGLGLLLAAHRLGLRRALGPLPRKGVVVAAIERQPAALDMQDVVGDIVQKIALMAHHDEAAAIGFEEGLQPHGSLEIEVVRRLVEQQEIGLGEQQRRKRDPHAPAAGEAVERLMLRLLRKTETGENARGARGSAMRVDGVEPLVDLADAVRVVRVLGLGEQFRPLLGRREHGLVRSGFAARRLLRDIADPRARRGLDASLVGLIDPGDDLEQRRLARAVTADQADMRLRRQRRRGLVENKLAPKAQRDAVEREHG